jgi:hypothetical protein
MSSGVDTNMAINFRKATDELFEVVSHEELAKEIGCSVATIRQARRAEGTTSYRSPPQGWEKAALKLAERKRDHFARLIAKLRAI